MNQKTAKLIKRHHQAVAFDPRDRRKIGISARSFRKGYKKLDPIGRARVRAELLESDKVVLARHSARHGDNQLAPLTGSIAKA